MCSKRIRSAAIWEWWHRVMRAPTSAISMSRIHASIKCRPRSAYSFLALFLSTSNKALNQFFPKSLPTPFLTTQGICLPCPYLEMAETIISSWHFERRARGEWVDTPKQNFTAQSETIFSVSRVTLVSQTNDRSHEITVSIRPGVGNMGGVIVDKKPAIFAPEFTSPPSEAWCYV